MGVQMVAARRRRLKPTCCRRASRHEQMWEQGKPPALWPTVRDYGCRLRVRRAEWQQHHV